MTGGVTVLLVGVGGQGVLTAAEILSLAAHHAGLPVGAGQLHGMSQRGGSVECLVRLGTSESAFAIGRAPDVVLGFERLETLRALPRLGPTTRVLFSDGAIVPFAMVQRREAYPSVEEILSRLRAVAPATQALDGRALAGQTGASRTLNVLLLGALSGLELLPLSSETLFAAVAERCPARFLEANRQAFELGRRWAQENPGEPLTEKDVG